jgi:beta-mannosidase
MKFPMRHSIDLCGSWQAAYVPPTSSEETTRPQHFSRAHPDIASIENSGMRTIDAQVPGNFELDLLAAGEIEDPFFGMNISTLTWVEHTDLYYSRRFTVHHEPDRPEGSHALVLEGVDCSADIFIDGKLVGHVNNALIEHVLPLNHTLPPGEHEIVVHLAPAASLAEDHPYPPGVGAGRASYESLYVRKAPHCYGWDIMPRALSAGIWRPISLQWIPADRLETVFLRTLRCNSDSADLLLTYQGSFADLANSVYEVEVRGACEVSSFQHRQRALFSSGRLRFSLGAPQLWWPAGSGAQPLYDCVVTLFRDGIAIDSAAFRHGIRTVKLERTSLTDAEGRGEFCFHVNGRKIFIMGSNHVPLDAYHSRDLERIPRALELASEAGINMLRCWGGNVYENDLFFDLCDERGILIWQDFAMACAVYPQDNAFQEVIRQEATAVVRRLRSHPCLALWAGDNECDQAYSWYACGDPNQNQLTRKVLPEVIQAEDPGRDYLPSSPYIDAQAYKEGDRWLPENHLWGPRDGFKSDYYRTSVCHFASEIGYHGMPSVESIKQFISEGSLWPAGNPGNPEWLLHATSPVPGVDIYDYRIELMRKQVREFFGTEPSTLEEFVAQSQYTQAEAKKFFIEMFRAAKWRRTGILWWNLIDGWPQFSDAVVDYYFRPKLAYHHIKRSQQKLCLVVTEPTSWNHALVACNDTPSDLQVDYRVREPGGSEVLIEGSGVVRSGTNAEFARIPAFAARQRFFYIEWRSALGQGCNHYLAGPPPFDPDQYRRWMEECGLL